MKSYRCVVCGYVYDPAKGDPGKAKPGTSFIDLPGTWVCPVCGADKTKFEPVDVAGAPDTPGAPAAVPVSPGVAPAAPVSPGAPDSAQAGPIAAAVVRRYSNGEITVVWQPAKCNHNGNCWRKLPQVFDTSKRPWVYIHGADSTAIAKVVEECPTGALTWEKARPDDEIRPK